MWAATRHTCPAEIPVAGWWVSDLKLVFMGPFLVESCRDGPAAYIDIDNYSVHKSEDGIHTVFKKDTTSVQLVEDLISDLPEVPVEETPEMPDLSIPKPDGEKLTAIYKYLEYLENAEEVAAAKEAFDDLDANKQTQVDELKAS